MLVAYRMLVLQGFRSSEAKYGGEPNARRIVSRDPSLHSGFRRAAWTPRRRLNL